MELLYLDNAATGWPKPEATIEAMVAYQRAIGGSPGRSGHRLSIEAGRIVYDTREALASLFEVQVRLGNIAAERHHLRSERFFYGMLGAQLAVIIATFAVAARKRNLLWSLGAAAGVFAVAFGAYVYLYV